MNNQTKWLHLCNRNLYKQYYPLIFVVFFITLLSGCGGSSGANDIDDPTIGARLSVQMTDANGQAISTAEAGSSVIIRVTATNDFGNAASGVTVAFATDRGTLSQDNALTNSQGIAQANLISTNSQVGVAIVTATATIDGTELTRTGQIELTPTTVTTPTLNIIAYEATCTTQITVIEAGQNVCLKTSVFDGTTPITNQVVEFSATRGSPSPDSSLTDSSGVATTTITSTTDIIGASIITANTEIDGTTYSNSANIEFSPFISDDDPDPVIDISLYAENCLNETNTAQSTEALCVRINLSQDGDPLSDQIIQLDAPVGTLRQTSGLTDINGNFLTYIDSVVRETGASTLTVTYQSFVKQLNYQFVPFTTNTANLNLTVLNETCSAEQNSIVAGESLCFQASLFSNNQAVANAIVAFEAPLGSLRQLTALTNSAGVAQAIIDSTDTTIGAAIATVSYDGVTNTANYQFSESPSQNQTDLLLTVRDSNCQNLTNETQAGTPLCLIANIKENGEPKSGQLFSFDVPFGTLEPASVLSDENGNGQVFLNSVTTDVGAGTATVTYGQFVKSANFEFIRGDQSLPTALTVEVKDQNCEFNVTAAAQGDPLCIEAQLIGEEGGIEDAIVEFATPLGVLVPNSALTDSLGIATVTLQTVNSELGAAEILATHSNLSDTASYQIITANTSRNLAVDTYRNDCITTEDSFGAGSAYCIAAVLTENGDPVADQIVTFETPIGELRQLTALTDSSGTARVIADTNTLDLGAGTVIANSNNLTDQANFEIVASDDSSNPRPDIILVAMQNGEVTNSFKADESIQIQATLLDEKDAPIPNTIMRYTAELGQLATTSALTDSSGVAQVTLSGTVSDVGAGAATASAVVEGVTYTKTYNYQILSSDAVELNTAKIGYFDSNNNFIEGSIGISISDSNNNSIPDLSAGGTMGLNVAVVNQNNQRITTPTPVSFTSSCVNSESGTLDEQVTTVNGEARSTYEDSNCATTSGNQDTIVATITVNNVAVTATRIIELLPDDIGSIEFIDAVPTSIVLKGTGGQNKQETSTLTFQVKSLLGNPVPQQRVNFSLDTTVGGLKVTPTESFTNSQGLVTTIVTAGNVPAAVRVSATTALSEGSNITTQSDLLSVNTGLPDQNSITLATEVINPEAHDFSGLPIQIHAYMADSFNNPVPDGTTINFTTEGGFIQPTCNTLQGHCQVTWTATNPRVDNHRITILATAIGHETFFDVNGNNVFDDADTPDGTADIHDQNTDSGLFRGDYMDGGFVDHSEAWRDDNEDGERQTSEIFIDYNNDNTFNAADGKFNGPHCLHNTLCGGENASKLNVRKAIVMIMSGSNAAYTLMTSALEPGTNSGLAHIANNHVIDSNDNGDRNGSDTDVVPNGGISIDSSGAAATNTEDRIILEESQSIQMTLAIADLAKGPGQTLPAGTTITLSTSSGALEGPEVTIVPNQLGSTKEEIYGGELIEFSLVNTNDVNTTGNVTTTGLLTITVGYPSSNRIETFNVRYTLIGR